MVKTIKELEKEIKEIEKNWKTPRDDFRWTKRNTMWFEAKAKLQTLKDVLNLIDEFENIHVLDDELDGVPRKLIDSIYEDWLELKQKIQGK